MPNTIPLIPDNYDQKYVALYGQLSNKLKDDFEKDTGKKITNLKDSNMIDFINYYGGEIEYINLNNEVPFVLISKKGSNNFKILVDNSYNPAIIRKSWEEESKNKKYSKVVLEHMNELLKNRTGKEELNYLLSKIFFIYIAHIYENVDNDYIYPKIEKLESKLSNEQFLQVSKIINEDSKIKKLNKDK